MKTWMTALLTLLIALSVLPGPAQAFELTIPEAEIDAYLQEDGTVLVEEQFTYAFEGDFNGVVRTLNHPEDTSIRGLEAREDGEVVPIETVEEIEHRIQRPGEDETFTVALTYAIHDAMEKGPEAAEFYWAFFDSSNETAYESMTIRVHAPDMSEDTAALGYGAMADESGMEENAAAVFGPARVPDGEIGDVRAAFDAALFPEMDETTEENAFTAIAAEEERREEAAAAFADRQELLAGAAPFLIGGALLLLLVPLFIDWQRYRPYKKDAVSRTYEKGVPEQQVSLPAHIWYLRPQAGSEQLTAALLDLVRQGYAEQLGPDEYKLVRTEGMNEAERILSSLLFVELGRDETFTMSRMEEKLKDAETYNTFTSEKQKWASAVHNEVKQAGLHVPKKGLRLFLVLLGSILTAAAVSYGVHYLFIEMSVLIPLAIGSFAAALLYHPRTERGYRVKEEWKDYKEEVEAYTPSDWRALDADAQQTAFTFGLGLHLASVTKLSQTMPKMDTSAPMGQQLQPEGIPLFIFAGLLTSSHFHHREASAAETHGASSGGGASIGGGTGVGGGGGGSGGF
ncbi:DUF2207 domain-containing protein [Alkalicoccus urumqiensis]|uniref:DUF2207 domain-containing protein n=1 Tax=Alkalicoccus urumqiensis TaxID=1548213 RepID=A0A2P6MLV4_ALKUR|nr:DUF2207 domain-containing protein [Alkalicoccus urumqiensis]PRO67266.1 hypothetical protein C6I21_01520 [Alkalicoccus urumqiensis]